MQTATATCTLAIYFLPEMIIETTQGTVTGAGIHRKLLPECEIHGLLSKVSFELQAVDYRTLKAPEGKTRQGEGKGGEEEKEGREEKGEAGRKRQGITDRSGGKGVQREPQLSARQHSTSHTIT